MTTYNYAELEGLWIVAGGSSSEAPTAAAIALAESGGDPTIPNGPYVMGLWQINTAPNANPEYTVAQMENPLANAVAAVKISGNGTNWNPWQTYTNGAYRQFLQSGVSPTMSTAQTNFSTMQFTPAQQTTIHNAALNGTYPPASFFISLGATTEAERDQLVTNPNWLYASRATGWQTIFDPTSPIINSGVTTLENQIPGYSTLSGFLSTISSGTFWKRALEVVGGGLILLLALDEMVKAAGATPPSTAIGNTITATTGVK